MNMPSSSARLWRFRSSLGAALALVPSFAAAQVPSAPLSVWAIGLLDGYIIMEHQETAIHVTAADVARGMVEVRGGSRFMVTAYSPARYTLDVFNRGAQFRAVHIEGLNQAVAVGPASALAAQQDVAAGRHVISLDYRFTLAPGTVPGTYAWPLELVARGGQAVR